MPSSRFIDCGVTGISMLLADVLGQRARSKIWTNLSGVALCFSLAIIRSELCHVVITLLLNTLSASSIIMAQLDII